MSSAVLKADPFAVYRKPLPSPTSCDPERDLRQSDEAAAELIVQRLAAHADELRELFLGGRHVPLAEALARAMERSGIPRGTAGGSSPEKPLYSTSPATNDSSSDGSRFV
jgi:hypothetical protein